MELLTEIPFTLDEPALAEQLRIEPGTDDATDLRALMQLALSVGKPKAAYAVAFVESRSDDTVRIGEATFTSRTLANNMKNVERVFPFVATCGAELDEAFPADGNMLKEYWWNHIKTALMAAARTHLGAHLAERFRLGKTASMHPGSGDVTVWPIEQQGELFGLLGDVRSAIGVTLTDSFLMVPNKSVSGIVFATEKDFRSCQVCHRENCPSRGAPFDPDLWAQVGHD